ncbi:MAG TPA: CsbD family protein [Acidobacteriaceae bacterium]
MTSSTVTSSTHDQTEGKVHQVKGSIKQAVGDLTNNPNLHDEGTAEKIDGKVEEKIGQVKRVFEK